jgi:hypothetical protein
VQVILIYELGFDEQHELLHEVFYEHTVDDQCGQHDEPYEEVVFEQQYEIILIMIHQCEKRYVPLLDE